MYDLKLIKANIKNGFWNYDDLKKQVLKNYESTQKDTLKKIEDLENLNKLTGNFCTELIEGYMKSFLEVEKMYRYFNKK